MRISRRNENSLFCARKYHHGKNIRQRQHTLRHQSSVKGITIKKQFLVIAAVLLVGIMVSVARTSANPNGHKVLVHVVSNIKKDDLDRY